VGVDVTVLREPQDPTGDEGRSFESLRNRREPQEPMGASGTDEGGNYESIRFLSSSVGMRQEV